MLKRIAIDKLRTGMFVEDLECSWRDNPLQMKRFLLSSESELEKLRHSAIESVIINTSLGLDAHTGSDHGVGRNNAADNQHSMDARLKGASDLLNASEQVVEQVFTAVRSGEHPSMAALAPVIAEVSDFLQKDPHVFISVARLKTKDETTFRHSIAVSALMLEFGRYLKMDEASVELLGLSGLTHDIGKMKVPDDILSKKGDLTDAERRIIRSHPELGHVILVEAGLPDVVLDICLHHHERIDGGGYPHRLIEHEISLPVRICTICDVYEAITAVRPYKRAWSQSDALAWMLEQRGLFDRSLLRHFVACLEQISRNAAVERRA